MKEHNHPDENIHDMEHDMHKEHETHHDMKHDEHAIHMERKGYGHTDHHVHMVADLRKRFWISLIITIPILVLSPVVQSFLGLGDSIRFTGDSYLLFVL